MSKKDLDPSPSAFDFDHFIKTKLEDLKSSGSYRHFVAIEKQAGTFPKFFYTDAHGNSRQATNWCTNDYLALSNWEDNIQVINEANTKIGIGSGGTRNISGSTVYHRQLERTIADWHQKENAILFNGAYQANQTALTTLGRLIPDLIFISDEENHASMIEGMRATNNKKYIFRHNDVDELQSILNDLSPSTPKIIVFESIYSISGTIAPVEKILAIAKKYNCLSYIDEVHAIGLYGSTGAGILEQLGLNAYVDFINGTLSKAIGTFGGYLAASDAWIDFIRSFGSGFIFTTSLPPAICIAANHSIEEIISNATLRDHFFKNVKDLRIHLDHFEIRYTGHETHITNIHIGNALRCKEIADRLLKEFGVYVQPINQPTVQEGEECLRVTITPRHTVTDINHFAKSLSTVLNQKIILTGRSSRLSKAQIEIVKQKIKQYDPNIHVEINYTDSRGDQLKDIPLHTQEGIDFFTEEVYRELQQGKADIAVHSLKDMSSGHFFGAHEFAVVDRDEVRDVAIFNSDILGKIKNNRTIKIGTCSFRRETMALKFLRKALPHFNSEIKIEACPIRGNIDTRLTKMSTGEYDGIILAVAGINRMFKNPDDATLISGLLQGKKIMILPLIECLPAPCQGAIVAESLKSNVFARSILNGIKVQPTHDRCIIEKRIADQYGSGCIQKFGVSSIEMNNTILTVAKGTDISGNEFEDWYGLNLKIEQIHPDNIIHSDQLGFTSIKTSIQNAFNPIPYGIYFIAHISALQNTMASSLENQRVWAAGTSTWYKLAQRGIWVEGCADSMGFKSIDSLLKTDLVSINPTKINILTNQTSAKKWSEEGYTAIGTYDLQYQSSLIDKYALKKAQLIFWNCFAHFDAVKEILPDSILHACLPGKTADQLRDLGINPIVFPTLDAFNQWKKKYSQQYIAA